MTTQFEEVLMTDKRKIYPSEPLTEEDRNFLRRIFCSVLPNQSTVDLSGSTFDTEKLQGYAIVLKQIDGKNLTSFLLIIA